MLVTNWMSKNVITVNEDDSMQEAMKLMKQHTIRMLPVLKDGSLVGVVTDRDLKRASASDATTLDVHEMLYLISKIKVKSIMSKNPISVSPDLTVEETAEVLLWPTRSPVRRWSTKRARSSAPSPRPTCSAC